MGSPWTFESIPRPLRRQEHLPLISPAPRARGVSHFSLRDAIMLSPSASSMYPLVTPSDEGLGRDETTLPATGVGKEERRMMMGGREDSSV